MSVQARYNWPRYWCKRGQDFHVGDDGFLIDPEGKFSKLYGSSAQEFSAIAEYPCLALLGEQGIGKSWAICEEFKVQHDRNCDPGVAYQFLDLAEYGDETRLLADSFQSAAMQQWQQGDDTYVLFFDSFDECQIQIPKLATLLVSQLKRLGPRLAQLRLPEVSWAIRRSFQANLDRSWSPLPLEELRRLVLEKNVRVIRCAADLHAYLMDCLSEIETQLHGHLPAVRELWDRQASTPETWRPVSENEFSDWVARRLNSQFEKCGFVALREVQVRPRLADRPGEETDIYVQGSCHLAGGHVLSVAAVIEVKGCWHRELVTAMETQLANRYLLQSTCQHGIYLVGWFRCAQWDQRDSRRTAHSQLSRDDVHRQLTQQAAQLSSNGLEIRAFLMNTGLG